MNHPGQLLWFPKCCHFGDIRKSGGGGLLSQPQLLPFGNID
jgi:hypothetical protein